MKSLMIKNFFYILAAVICSCSGDYKDISATTDEIKFYDLQENEVFDDNGTTISLAIPQEWRRVDEELLSEKSIMQFVFGKGEQQNFLDAKINSALKGPSLSEKSIMLILDSIQKEISDAVYTLSIDKLESANTNKYSDKQYIDSFSKPIEAKGIIGFFGLPKSIYKNLQVVSFDNNLIINEKYFARRVLYFNDRRFINTELGNLTATEFHFITIHNKRKYTLTIVCYSDVISGSDFVSLINTIAGSIEFN